MAKASSEFSKRLKNLMKNKGLATQRELARGLDVSEIAVSNYVTKGRVPEWDVLVRMADYFGVTTDWLLTGRDPCEAADNRPPPRRFPHITKREQDYLDKTLVILRAEGEAKGLVKLLTGQIDGLYEEVRKLSSKAGSRRAKTKRAS